MASNSLTRQAYALSQVLFENWQARYESEWRAAQKVNKYAFVPGNGQKPETIKAYRVYQRACARAERRHKIAYGY